MLETGRGIEKYQLPRVEVELTVVAVQRTRERAKHLIAEKKAILWRALDFTRRLYGHLQQLETIT